MPKSRWKTGQAIVCLVGENIRHTPGIAGRAFQVLSNMNIRMISQGASLLNLGFVIADADLPAPLRLCTQNFSPNLIRRYLPEGLT